MWYITRNVYPIQLCCRDEKEAMKAYETPEEKRARRLAKKEQKERKRKAAMGWDTETLVSPYRPNKNLRKIICVLKLVR